MATELRIRGFDTPSSPSSLYGFVDFVPRRRGRRIRTEAMARTRQDKEQQEAEVAAIEDSFPVREAAAAPPTEEGGFDEELTLAGEDGDWVIRLEQSFNVFLTDTVILILDTMYRGRDYARFFVPRPWPGCRILVRKVDMLDGVTILRSGKVKDEIVLDGNDIELVSRSVALIN